MPQKPTVENRWWVETTFKKPKRAKSETEMPELPVAMAFYAVARDYDQDRARKISPTTICASRAPPIRRRAIGLTSR